MKLSQLKPLEKNPFKSKGDKQIAAIGKSISEFEKMMQIRKIVVDENFQILGGNKRFFALKALGRVDIPDSWVDQVTGLTEAEKREFIVKDNSHWGSEWDFDLLKDWGVDLDDWGVQVDWEEPQPEASEDDYEIPDEIVTDIVVGDLFEIGVHRLICGDSTDKETVERLFNNLQFDLIVTDPPYNVDYAGKNEALNASDKGNRIQSDILNDKMTDKAFYQFLLDFHKNFMIHCKPGGVWYVWHSDGVGHFQRNSFLEAGLEIKQNLIWVKNNLVLGRQDYQWQHEPCLYGWKPGDGHYFIEWRTEKTVIDDNINFKKLSKEQLLELVKTITETTPTTILRENKPQRSELHPTMKPVKLIGKLINNSSRINEIVADGFLGSGTTMVAAHQLNRRCLGCELEPKYCQVIIDRMRKLDPGIVIKKNGEVI